MLEQRWTTTRDPYPLEETAQPPLVAVPVPYVDYDPADYIIQPCRRCATWWAEIVCGDNGMQVVREWHHPSCAVPAEWE